MKMTLFETKENKHDLFSWSNSKRIVNDKMNISDLKDALKELKRLNKSAKYKYFLLIKNNSYVEPECPF